MTQIINIREYPQWLEPAADYFSSKWGIKRKVYHDSMTDSLSTEKTLPRWYLMLRGDKIIGCFGLIKNDFMVRTDLFPWLCALYVEEEERGQKLGAKLLAHGCMEAAKLGFDKIYLNTDHIGYYEKYGWRYMGDDNHQSGEKVRVYEADCAIPPEEMSAFFDIRADIYDAHMLNDLELDVFYESIAAQFSGLTCENLLDLGCGTGLELERLFEFFPDLRVTGVDLSSGMLEKLKSKYPRKPLILICGSYFDVDFGGEYDHVLSTYSLHHFSEEEKLVLYKKIFAALKAGGRFIFGDYTVLTIELQREFIEACNKIRRENGVADGEFIHFDTPFTAETEIRLMKAAGFARVDVAQAWENASIIVAGK